MIISGTFNLQRETLFSQYKVYPNAENEFLCDTLVGTVTFNLLEIAELTGFLGCTLIISDFTANSSVNNITINAQGSDTINGINNQSLIINSDGKSISIQAISNNQWIVFSTNGSALNTTWNLIQGDALLGGDPTVFSDIQKVVGNVISPILGATDIYNLKATTDFDGSSNVYVKYIGSITVDLGSNFFITSNASVFECTDIGLTGTITSPMANNGFVTNALSGVSEEVSFVIINPDNTIGNSNEYYLYLLIGNVNVFTANASLDLTIITNSTLVTYTQNL